MRSISLFFCDKFLGILTLRKICGFVFIILKLDAAFYDFTGGFSPNFKWLNLLHFFYIRLKPRIVFTAVEFCSSKVWGFCLVSLVLELWV